MKKITALLLIVSLCIACIPAFAEDTLKIVCTSFPCYDFARAVAGENAQISMLIKPGSEVHSFEPAPSDVLSIATADLFVYVGGESDAWVEDILASFGDDAPQTLRFFDCVEALEEEHDHEGEHEYDEHIWTSQENASLMLDALCNALCALDADNSEVYTANAAAYEAEIVQIQAEITEIVDHAARKELVFADRFPFLYFAREYDLEYVAAFSSCSSESEASAKTVAMLIDKVKTQKVPVIYILELSNAKLANTIAEETGAEIRTFYSMQNISEADFSAGETYVSLMKKNIEVLKEGIA